MNSPCRRIERWNSLLSNVLIYYDIVLLRIMEYWECCNAYSVFFQVTHKCNKRKKFAHAKVTECDKAFVHIGHLVCLVRVPKVSDYRIMNKPFVNDSGFFFVAVTCQTSTAILSPAIKYSMFDLIRNVNYRAITRDMKQRYVSNKENDARAPTCIISQ